jgi:hypothetical protein
MPLKFMSASVLHFQSLQDRAATERRKNTSQVLNATAISYGSVYALAELLRHDLMKLDSNVPNDQMNGYAVIAAAALALIAIGFHKPSEPAQISATDFTPPDFTPPNAA